MYGRKNIAATSLGSSAQFLRTLILISSLAVSASLTASHTSGVILPFPIWNIGSYVLEMLFKYALCLLVTISLHETVRLIIERKFPSVQSYGIAFVNSQFFEFINYPVLVHKFLEERKSFFRIKIRIA